MLCRGSKSKHQRSISPLYLHATSNAWYSVLFCNLKNVDLSSEAVREPTQVISRHRSTGSLRNGVRSLYCTVGTERRRLAFSRVGNPAHSPPHEPRDFGHFSNLAARGCLRTRSQKASKYLPTRTESKGCANALEDSYAPSAEKLLGVRGGRREDRGSNVANIANIPKVTMVAMVAMESDLTFFAPGKQATQCLYLPGPAQRLTCVLHVGKTAPRLIQDLLNYDPRCKEKNGWNVLADPEPRYKKGVPSPLLHSSDCHHTLARKDAQTHSPASANELPDNQTEYVVASYCLKCLHHFTISINFYDRKELQVPCMQSDQENPLHHFRFIESPKEGSKKKVSKKYELPLEVYRFACSGRKCPALLEIQISGPRLSDSLLSLINDDKILGARGRRELDKDPVRYEGQQPSTPAHAFWYLRSYLADAKGAKDVSQLKRIAKRNKKYKVTFADECDELFKYLGFRSVEELSENPDVSRVFVLPC